MFSEKSLFITQFDEQVPTLWPNYGCYFFDKLQKVIISIFEDFIKLYGFGLIIV